MVTSSFIPEHISPCFLKDAKYECLGESWSRGISEEIYSDLLRFCWEQRSGSVLIPKISVVIVVDGDIL